MPSAMDVGGLGGLEGGLKVFDFADELEGEPLRALGDADGVAARPVPGEGAREVLMFHSMAEDVNDELVGDITHEGDLTAGRDGTGNFDATVFSLEFRDCNVLMEGDGVDRAFHFPIGANALEEAAVVGTTTDRDNVELAVVFLEGADLADAAGLSGAWRIFVEEVLDRGVDRLVPFHGIGGVAASGVNRRPVKRVDGAGTAVENVAEFILDDFEISFQGLEFAHDEAVEAGGPRGADHPLSSLS